MGLIPVWLFFSVCNVAANIWADQPSAYVLASAVLGPIYSAIAIVMYLGTVIMDGLSWIDRKRGLPSRTGRRPI